MILFRYLGRQILQIMVAVSLILLVVGFINRFIQYLGQAVAGEMASDLLLLLILYRLPDFLLVILPLALFLAIMLAFGRMYAENEMTILISSGVSQGRLLFFAQGAAALVMLTVAVLSLEVVPWGIRNTELLRQKQDQLTELDLMVAGQFQEFGDGSRVTYAERIDNDRFGRELQHVFVVSTTENERGESSNRIIVSETARPEVNGSTGSRYMRLEDVHQYDGVPGRADFAIAQFDVQSIRLPEAARIENIEYEKAVETAELWGSEMPQYQAELQWRISAILLVPIITLIAVPLSRVQPRQGRYSKLVPAALFYAVYFILLQICRNQLADGNLSMRWSMWWVHSAFLAYGLYGISQSNVKRVFLRRGIA